MTGADSYTSTSHTTAEEPETFEGELDRIRGEIGKVENRIELSKANGDRAKARQVALKNDANALARILAEREKLFVDAKKKLEEACLEKQFHEVDVNADLDEKIKGELANGFTQLNSQMTKLRDEIQTAEGKLPDHEDEQSKQQKEVERAQETLVAANKAMLNIPAEIKAHLDALQKAVTMLHEAASSGQSKKAFVMIKEIERLDSAISTLLSPAEETKRVEAARNAAKGLKAAEAHLNSSSGELRTLLYSLQLKRQQLEDLRKSYLDDLKKLYANEATH